MNFELISALGVDQQSAYAGFYRRRWVNSKKPEFLDQEKYDLQADEHDDDPLQGGGMLMILLRMLAC